MAAILNHARAFPRGDLEQKGPIFSYQT